MTKTISQLISSFMVLLLLLMIPYAVGVSIKSDNFSRTTDILETSAQSSAVLGASDYIGESSLRFESASIINFSYYFIGFLALISIGSFVKYKIVKK